MSEVTNVLRSGLVGVGGKWLGDILTKDSRRVESTANDAAAEAASTAAAAAVLGEGKKKKAAALLSQSSAGFSQGASTARQFLTSL